MRDILGIAVGALLGLLTLALQPWTPLWWGGVIASGSITIVAASHIVWANIPEWLKLRFGGKIKSAAGVTILLAVFIGGFVASHWPTGFLTPAHPATQKSPEPDYPLISRLNHFILRCDVPPPPPSTTPLDSLWQLEDYKQKLDIYGDATGVAFTMVTIRGGVRIEGEAVSDEAKLRFPFGIRRFTLEVRRIDKNEIISAFFEPPAQLAFYRLIPPNPLAPDSINVVRMVEKMLGVADGVCKVI